MSILRESLNLVPARMQHSLRKALIQRRNAVPKTVEALARRAFPNLVPLNVQIDAQAVPHVTMITDSVAPGQLMGGVGTAVLLSAMLAQHRRQPLRIVTRQFRCTDAAVRALLDIQGIPFNQSIEILFSDGSSESAAVPLGPRDLVITTSWWVTSATRHSVPAHQILYLLQEDERMFYPGGDQHLLCDEVLNDTDIRYAVNTDLLLSHFKDSNTAGPANRGLAFEPAFPSSIYYPEAHGPKYNLVFYARPSHPRNLFLRGVEVLQRAIAEGILPPDQWNIHFFGVDIPRVDFGARFINYHDTLSWSDYATLIRKADLGFSLMYTPHPSYPPLDLAASGAVVVTNAFGNKGTKAQYSDNILYAPLSVDGLLQGIREGVARVVEDTSRQHAYQNCNLNRDWMTSFESVIKSFD